MLWAARCGAWAGSGPAKRGTTEQPPTSRALAFRYKSVLRWTDWLVLGGSCCSAMETPRRKRRRPLRQCPDPCFTRRNTLVTDPIRDGSPRFLRLRSLRRQGRQRPQGDGSKRPPAGPSLTLGAGAARPHPFAPGKRHGRPESHWRRCGGNQVRARPLRAECVRTKLSLPKSPRGRMGPARRYSIIRFFPMLPATGPTGGVGAFPGAGRGDGTC